MFTVQDRDSVQARLLAHAEADGAITGAAFTGSLATRDGDHWSDTDLVLAVRGELTPAVNQWTRWLYHELGALHHWDLPAGPRTIRVFLLPGWLELDLTFAPEDQFGPRGPQWRTIFGQPQPLEPFPALDPGHIAGLAWHHALHARICIERGRWWQAEYWISATRDHVITLACLRLGYPAHYAKGAHLLPEDLTAPLEATLIRSPGEPELRRTLAATITVLTGELERSDPALAARLRPMLAELAGRQAGTNLRATPAPSNQRSPVTSNADQLTTTDGSHTSPVTVKPDIHAEAASKCLTLHHLERAVPLR